MTEAVNGSRGVVKSSAEMERALSTKLIQGDVVRCPSCGEQQEGKVEDYVVPGRVGHSSKAEDQCIDCYARFAVICTSPGQYEVLATESREQ